jgi:thiol-disulfide isomerase/thioredoxin
MEKTYKILKLLILMLAFAVIIVGASMLYDNLSSQMEIGLATTPRETEETGETGAQASAAPDFTVYDLDGNAHKLSDFRGKPVILNFWASWCGPCKMEMPDLETAYQEYGDQIQFMLVDLTDGSQETVEKASAFIKEQGYTFPVFYDTAMEGAYAYGVAGIPVTYFINGEGVFVAYYQGAMSADILQQGIEMLM